MYKQFIYKIGIFIIKKCVKNEYEFIVFNDAKDYPDISNSGDATMKQKVIDICNEHNSYQKDIPNLYSYKHSIVLNTIHKYQIENPDKYLIINGDLFLINYLDISKYDKEGAGIVLQERFDGTLVYALTGLVYLDTTKNKNYELLDWSIGNGDTGTMIKIWVKSQINEGEIIPRLLQLRHNSKYQTNTKNLYFFNYYVSTTWNENYCPEFIKNNKELYEFIKTDSRNINGNFFVEIFDNCFMHYRGGGCNWMNQDYNIYSEIFKKNYNEHKEKVDKLLKII